MGEVPVYPAPQVVQGVGRGQIMIGRGAFSLNGPSLKHSGRRLS
jgi:hypothetical protein